MTSHVKLLGHHLRHSISPLFQQAAFNEYGLDIQYGLLELEPVQLAPAIHELRQPEYLGANVTVPYKEKVMPLLDELDELSSKIGAVNTIVNCSSRLTGYNTDAEGFLLALTEEGGFKPKNKRVVILGSGGAARAASFILIKTRVSTLTIVGRNPEHTKSLKSALVVSGIRINVLSFDEKNLEESLANCDLLVNCTSVGMKFSETEGQSPLAARLIPRGIFVYDVIYNPQETCLLKDARHAGAETLGGLPMLVYQGAAAFELWTRKKAPVALMLKVARHALEG